MIEAVMIEAVMIEAVMIEAIGIGNINIGAIRIRAIRIKAMKTNWFALVALLVPVLGHAEPCKVVDSELQGIFEGRCGKGLASGKPLRFDRRIHISASPSRDDW